MSFSLNKTGSFMEYLAVLLIAVQFSFDSCVYLSSIAFWIEECGGKNVSHYLFVVQAVSASVQIVASFIIGDIAQRVGSIKWCIIALFLLSFAGNFLYSCASTISLSTILGGRILCGVASASGALIYSYITAIHKERTKVFKFVSAYRTASGFFMAISQLVAIFASYCDFKIHNFKVNSNNGPTFVCSFIILAVTALLVFVLENPAVPTRKTKMSFTKALQGFFSAPKWTLAGGIILLWGMFFASFLMSEVVYFMPVFLTESLGWETKFQGVAFMVASIIGICGSLVFPHLIEMPIRKKEKEFNSQAESQSKLSEKSHISRNSEESADRKQEFEAYKKNALYNNQIVLSLVSLLIALVGQAFMIGAAQVFRHRSLPHINTGCFFVGGMSLVMLAYNGMASTFPALFSVYIDPQVKLQLMPAIGAVAALGKLIAPIVLSNLYQTKLGLSIAVGLGMILTALTLMPVFLLKDKKH
ncbi:hypothetical protein OXX59_007488 [Metschnikowia pulcherrima]